MPPIDESLPERAYYKLLQHMGEKETLPNRGPVVEWAISRFTKRKAGSWSSWCAGAVCTSYLEAGSEQMKELGSLSVQTLYDRMKKMGLLYLSEENVLPKESPRLGDLVFFGEKENLHHVALFCEIHHTTDADQRILKTYVSTLDGNHNNQVAYAARTEWCGFGKILY